jgi:hypothetical protein
LPVLKKQTCQLIMAQQQWQKKLLLTKHLASIESNKRTSLLCHS